MSFGQLMAHIASINGNACANASGLPVPEFLPRSSSGRKDREKTEGSKDTAIPFLLKESFEFCDKAIAAMTPERWDTVCWSADKRRNLTGFEWLFALLHAQHPRASSGTGEMFTLRIKGVKPPDYRF